MKRASTGKEADSQACMDEIDRIAAKTSRAMLEDDDARTRTILYYGKEEIRALLDDLLIATDMDVRSYNRIRKHCAQVVERLERLVGL